MGAQLIKHIIWDDLATSGWKHLFPMQSNLKKFEEIWRFILLIRSLSRRCARRQNLNVVVWVCIEKLNVHSCACQKAYSTYIIANLNDIIVVENHLAVGVVMY